MNIIRMISHKIRQLYGSILLVLLVILYYYYTRLYEGATSKKPKPKSTPATAVKQVTTTTATAVKPITSGKTTTTATAVKPITSGKTTTTSGKTTTTSGKTTTTTPGKPVPVPINTSKKVEEIQNSYLAFYQLMSNNDKQKIKKVYNHFIENVVKDEFPSFS